VEFDASLGGVGLEVRGFVAKLKCHGVFLSRPLSVAGFDE
jgi:hypothetical protein